MSRRPARLLIFFSRDEMPEHITLGGRQFKHCQNSTIEHDYVTMDRFSAAGLAVIDMPEGSTPHAFVSELVSRAIRTGQLFPLLACMLIPADLDDTDWTPSIAAETEAHLRKLSTPEDKQTLQGQVAGMFASFFQTGLTTLRTFPKFSESQESQ